MDHPRACGEKAEFTAPTSALLGSPPRMRGKVIIRHHLSIWDRITPAHAGKRKVEEAMSLLDEDHPRACGEKSVAASNRASYSGSPPRMRGKDSHAEGAKKVRRITPAHAGKSKTVYKHLPAPEDHPRACGEKPAGTPPAGPLLGSPPRMRGKAYKTIANQRSVRITPAHAGKS